MLQFIEMAQTVFRVFIVNNLLLLRNAEGLVGGSSRPDAFVIHTRLIALGERCCWPHLLKL